jgi:hypothetical protein
MRLTTLSRKIDKTPTQLIAFLEKNGIILDKGLHSILESETVEMVLAHFLPEGFDEEVPTPKTELVEKAPIVTPNEIEPEVKKEIVAPVKKKKKAKKAPDEVNEEIIVEDPKIEEIPLVEEIKNEPKTGTVDDLENEDFEKIELIKAKKVKLEGFKVVGKIDLPEKPKKEVAEPVDNPDAKIAEKNSKKPRPDDRKFDRDRKKNHRGTLRNPLSYEERKKREEQEKQRQLRKKMKAEKLRNKKLYEESIKTKTLNTPKKKKKNLSTKQHQASKSVVVHRNPIKRLWAWLNGQYDKF